MKPSNYINISDIKGCGDIFWLVCFETYIRDRAGWIINSGIINALGTSVLEVACLFTIWSLKSALYKIIFSFV